MRLREIVLPVTTAGGAGAATGSTRKGIPGGRGRLVSVGIKYTGVPATTDVVLKCEHPSALFNKTLFTRNDSNTNFAPKQVMEKAVDGNGADQAGDAWVHPMVYGNLVAEVAQSNAAANGVVVTALIEVT